MLAMYYKASGRATIPKAEHFRNLTAPSGSEGKACLGLVCCKATHTDSIASLLSFWFLSSINAAFTEMKKTTFKQGVSAQDGARKREDSIVSARRHKRDDNLNQRRRTMASPDVSLADQTIQNDTYASVRVYMQPVRVQRPRLSLLYTAVLNCV